MRTLFIMLPLLGLTLQPAAAESCRMAGDAVVAVAVRGAPDSLVGQTGYRISSREVCFGGQTYSRKDVRTKAVAEGVATRSCAAQVASASGRGSGSNRGNGC